MSLSLTDHHDSRRAGRCVRRIKLNLAEIQCQFVQVRLWKTVLTMLMLVTWFTCTIHCQLEKEGLFRKAAAQAAISTHSVASTASDEADSNVCDWVTTGGLQFSDARVSAPDFFPVPVIAFLGIAFSDLVLRPDESCGQSEWSVAPPELRASFNFVFRTALPARAPSIAS